MHSINDLATATAILFVWLCVSITVPLLPLAIAGAIDALRAYRRPSPPLITFSDIE